MSVIDAYLREIDDSKKCPIWRLTELAKIRWKSARKAIDYYTVGKVIPSNVHCAKGVGVRKGTTMDHHTYLSTPFTLTIQPFQTIDIMRSWKGSMV